MQLGGQEQLKQRPETQIRSLARGMSAALPRANTAQGKRVEVNAGVVQSYPSNTINVVTNN